MKAKKVTLLMVLTVISLLTIFLVLLLDDNVLAAEPNHESVRPELTTPEFLGGPQKIKEVMENASVSHKQSH